MPEELTRVVRVRRASGQPFDHYTDHGDTAADEMNFLTPDIIDDFAIAGPPSRCLEKINELESLGVSEIASGFLNGELDQMAEVGRQITVKL